MENLLIFAGMAALTFLTRYLMIALLDREIPHRLKLWLRFIPPAILSALVTPALFVQNSQVYLEPAVIATALVGTLAAWKTRNVFLTILAGLAAYWLAQAVRLLF